MVLMNNNEEVKTLEQYKEEFKGIGEEKAIEWMYDLSSTVYTLLNRWDLFKEQLTEDKDNAYDEVEALKELHLNAQDGNEKAHFREQLAIALRHKAIVYKYLALALALEQKDGIER